ncbi:MAG: tRNA glutamyl-Q(34) synthetase GluQRS, partial [Methyloversatilis sp.]|nr:tRNA glutamyl-Q(34) synthetase GluQRS [Methyloversatilis sp.]
RALGLPQPRYAHVPVVLDAQGEKLSKQTRAPALEPAEALTDLAEALAFLRHPPPAEVVASGREDLLAWAVQRWTLTALSGTQ